MTTELYIAVAAQTPVYLPLYVAIEHNFFGKLPQQFSLQIKPAPSNYRHDADNWVHTKISSSTNEDLQYVFGICDPYKAFNSIGTTIIATIVTKAAFWGINTDTQAEHLIDAHNFERIIAFPPGMTGYLLYELTEREGKKGNSTWSPNYIPAIVGNELNLLTKEPQGTLVITPNLFDALELCMEEDSHFNRKFSYAKHADYGDFFLTGLIARNTVITEHTDLVNGLVAALQCAVIEIQKHPHATKTIDALLNGLDKRKTAHNELVAKKVIDALNDDAIFPIKLTVTPSTWASTVSFHRKLSTSLGEEPTEKEITNSIKRDVNNTFAEKAFRDIVLNSIALWKPKPWRPIVSSVVGIGAFYYLYTLIARLPWDPFKLIFIVVPYVFASQSLILSILDPTSFTDNSKWRKIFHRILLSFIGLAAAGLGFIDENNKNIFCRHWFPFGSSLVVLAAIFATNYVKYLYEHFKEDH